MTDTRKVDSATWRPSLGAWIDGDAGMVRVWAPDAARVAVRAAGDRADTLLAGTALATSQKPARGLTPDVPLAREDQGYFAGRVPWLLAGVRYWIVLDDEVVVPDPVSRFQPVGVHGPSEVIDPRAFAWHDEGWRGRSIDELSIYELHVGTFTLEGTFAAAADRLPALVELGVTAVELMPVAAFPGRWNWGYDPAAQFAPSERYGRPDDLRRFVDRAHALGLATILDVVYNHFGPDGAYAVVCSPQFFSDRHRSPWGAGINLDGPGSGAVRRFFVENALHWLIEYRIDGLRLDATHALIDDSREHVLAELATAVRHAITDREVVLIAEDNRNLREILEPVSNRGWGFDGVWSDDFHHIVRRMTAGDGQGYYRDYAGSTSELARTLRDGWLYRGEHSVHAGGPRGTDPRDLPLAAFVICLQNHDQVGNRAFGDRLHHTIDGAVYRAATVLLLLAPETPLLFMGQEWAASTPFQYFTDHAGELGRQVREGRREEFKQFAAFADAATHDLIPDPQAPETFERSHLSWDERTQPPHAAVLALHREALALRRTLAPEGRCGALDAGHIDALDDGAVFMRRRRRDGGGLLVVARLSGAGPVRVIWAGLKPRPYENIERRAGEGTNVRILDTEAPSFTGDPQPIAMTIDDDAIEVRFARPGAVVLRAPDLAGHRFSGASRSA